MTDRPLEKCVSCGGAFPPFDKTKAEIAILVDKGFEERRAVYVSVCPDCILGKFRETEH